MNDKCENCILHKQGFFRSQDENVRIGINQCKSAKKFKKGKSILIEGSTASKILCIQTGKVKIVKKLSNGREMIISIEKSGDVAGLFDLFNKKNSFSAFAIEETQLCLIEKKTILNLLESSSALSMSLMNKMSEEKHIIDVRLASMAQKNVRERLAHLILLLSMKFSEKEGKKIRLTVKLTREEMASMIGTVNETVIRFMTEFKEEGLIEEERKTIYILDMDRLREFSGLKHDHVCTINC